MGRQVTLGLKGDDCEERTGRLATDGTGCLWRGGDRVGSSRAGHRGLG